MKPFFFITCYDQITAEIMAAALNTLSNINCQSVPNKFLLPTAIEQSVDDFIKKYQTDENRFHGNIFNFFYLELEQRKHTEKINHLFKIGHINVPLIISIEFLLYSWTKSGLSIDKIFIQLIQQLMIDTHTRNIFTRYNFNYIYNKILHYSASFPEQYQASVKSVNGQLFLLALSIILTFTANDVPLAEESFNFLDLLTKKSEINRLINHITGEETDISEENYKQLILALHKVEKIIEDASAYVSEEWQLELIKFCAKNMDSLTWPRIQSQIFMLLERSKLIDSRKYYLDSNSLYIRNNKIYYELILLSPFESILEKDKIINSERISRVKEQGAGLIYDLSGEALTFSGEMDHYWMFFHKTLQEAGIPASKVYLICSNYNVNQYYSAWASKNNIKYLINVIGNSFWIYLRSYELSVNPEFIARKTSLIDIARRTVENNELRPKYYMCLNLKAHIHRTAILLYLLHANHFNKGIITYFGRTQLLPKAEGDTGVKVDRLKIAKFIQQLPESEGLIAQINKLEDLLPITYDKLAGSLFSEAWPLSQFIPEMSIYGDIKQIDTYFEIITETYFSDNQTLFITEKTLRSFIRFQFFIVIGSPHTLKYLKEIGFQTFSPYIDESYDNIADPHSRMTAIFKEINKLCLLSPNEIHELYCKLWPRILHNFEHFINNMQDICKSETEKMFEQLTLANKEQTMSTSTILEH